MIHCDDDVIALSALGQPAVDLCSNTISDAQVEKLTDYARQLAAGHATLRLDADAEGDPGAKEALWKLAEAGLELRLGWSRSMHGGIASQLPFRSTTFWRAEPCRGWPTIRRWTAWPRAPTTTLPSRSTLWN